MFRTRMAVAVAAAVLASLAVPIHQPAQAAARPNIFFYNLDDLRDQVVGGVDPLAFMPRVRAWMADGTRFKNSYVSDPSCCPSRSAMMTGRYPHNNGVTRQDLGPNFDLTHTMACYLKSAGYATYVDGKFLTTWPKTKLPPCFDHSTVMWSGYNNVAIKTDGVDGTATGYSTKFLGARGRQYINSALTQTKPFLLYETPQAPHWVPVANPDGTTSKLAIPEVKYADAPVGPCTGPPEADRSDKPPYVRYQTIAAAESQRVCESHLRAIMTADDEFGATMQLLADKGVLDSMLVIFSSDNGYFWGEHSRIEKFMPYDPSVRVPLWIRWPGRLGAGLDSTRVVSQLDLLPTMLEAAGATIPAGAPALDGESLLQPSGRSTMFAEYYLDTANGNTATWKMIRTPTVKYIQTYATTGAVNFKEYYNLAADPAENVNLLKDASTANDPSASELSALATKLTAFATCAGAACVK